MMMTLEHVHILDQADRIVDMIKQSDVMKDYDHALQELENNKEAQQLIRSFKHIREHYEDVQRFGRYHPDYQEIMKNVRSAKRKMDMNEYVAAFKLAERQLQTFLDDISELIARSVSDQIIVPKENGLLADSGCSSGSCGTGGSCGCQAS